MNEFDLGREAAIRNLKDLGLVGRLIESGRFKEMPLGPCHETKDYKIIRWIKPDEIDQCQQFTTEGPGHHGFVYLALSEDCGPQFIRALQAAYEAGLHDERFGKNPDSPAF